MARNHGRILASIWSDEDFLVLDSAAQRLYMMLVSQPNLTHAGTLSVTIRRWSNLTNNETSQSIVAALKTLSDARFVIVDWDTEELLVRTLIRNDGVFKQPRVFQVAADEILSVSSRKLRSALRAELDRLPLEEVTDKVGKDGTSPREQVARLVKELLNTLPHTPGDTPPDTPAGTHSDTPADTHPEGYAQGSRQGSAYARTPSPSPAPAPSPSPALSEGADFAATDTAGTLIAEYLDQCRKRPPGQFLGHLGRTIKALLADTIDPDDIRAGLSILRERGLNPSALPGAVNEAMNSGRRIPPPTELTPRNQRNLALVQHFADLEAQQQPNRGEIA